MSPLRRSLVPLALTAAVQLAGFAAHAIPIITTFAQYSTGPVTDADGPQLGGALASAVSTTGGASLCGITGNCSGSAGQAFATAAQNETPFGIFSGLIADGTFFSGGATISSLTARTTWAESPSVAGPTSISLFIKPGELVLSTFAGPNNPIEARYLIELTVNGTRVFFSEAVLTPSGLVETGTDLGGTPFADADFPNNVHGYTFDPLFTTLALGNLTPADVVEYVMEVRVSGPGFETGGRARIGDPFDLTGGGSSIAFTVPEPGVTLMLGIVGAIALAVWREREKRRSRRR